MFDRAAWPRRTRIGAPRGKTGSVEGADCVARWRHEAYRSAVCSACLCPVQRAQDQQFGQLASVPDALIQEVTDVPDSQRCQRRVIELLGAVEVVAAKADMREDAYATRSS